MYDFLEHEVDESFYKKDKESLKLIKKLQQEGYDPQLSKKEKKLKPVGIFNNYAHNKILDSQGIAQCVAARDYKSPIRIIEES